MDRIARLRRAHLVSSVAAALSLLGFSSQAQAVNLLVNPGFEAPPDTADINSNVSGWTLQFDCQRAAFSNHTPGGKYMIWGKTWQPVGGGVSQLVNSISGGTQYTLSTWNFFEGAYPQSTATTVLRLNWKDAGGAAVGTPSELLIPATAPGLVTGVWTQNSLLTTAPAAAAQVEVYLGWMNGDATGQAQSVFFDDVVLDGAGIAPLNSTWINANSGDWNASANWANGTVPNATGATAEFFGAISAPRTVYTDLAVTAGTLDFNNANTYVITGAGSLTLQSPGTQSSMIKVRAGTHKISLPLTIASNTTLDVAASSTLKISNPMTVNAGKVVSQTGAGTVVYESIINVLGGGAILNIQNPTHAHALSIASGGRAVVAARAPSAPRTFVTLDSLSVAAGGFFDLTNNAAAIGGTSEATIRTMLSDTRIRSSTALAPQGLGYTAASGGVVNVSFTLRGDATMDRTVNFDDLLLLAASYNGSGTFWRQGDFNYDGTTNFDDLLLLAANYNQTISGSLDGDWALAQSAVPEPTIALLLPGLAGLALRRRH